MKAKRLRDVALVLSSNVDKVVKADETPVRLCNYMDVYKNGFIQENKSFNLGSATAAEIKKFRLQVDDVIITKDSETPDDIGVPALVKSTADDLVCGYHLSILRTDRRRMIGPFLYWHLLSKKSREDFGISANGVTRFGLTLGAIKNIPINVPDLATQRRIVEFLDARTGWIDRLIGKKRRLAGVLAEKRATLIAHAVTKGLDPTVPMKITGIDWLGDIPDHWAVLLLNRIVRLRSGDFISSDDIDLEGPHPVYGGNGVRGHTEQFNTVGPIVLVGRQGAHCGNVHMAKGEIWVSEHALRCFPEKNLDPGWLGYTLGTMNLNQHSVSAAQPGLSMDSLKHLRVPVPPLDAQRRIAQFLDERVGRIDGVIGKVEESVKRLREYRAALISAAVTGQGGVETDLETPAALQGDTRA